MAQKEMNIFFCILCDANVTSSLLIYVQINILTCSKDIWTCGTFALNIFI